VDGEERQNAAAYLRNGKIRSRDLLL
jgi:hypothetical protein